MSHDLDSQILRNLELLRVHQEVDSANIHLLLQWVNNANVRLCAIEAILEKCCPKKAISGTITFGGKMDITVHLSDVPQKASAHEWTGPLGTGTEVPPVGTITFASDNAAVTVDANTGQLAYVSAGVANISFADSGNSITGTGSVTVVADAAVSGTVTFA